MGQGTEKAIKRACMRLAPTLRLCAYSLLTMILSIVDTQTTIEEIDKMHVEPFGGYIQDYSIDKGLALLPNAEKYALSDGSEWFAGAGWHPSGYASLNLAANTGSQLIFDLTPKDANGIIFQNTDYDGGEHLRQHRNLVWIASA